MPKRINRVIYRFWHNLSNAGKVGYIGKDTYYPLRTNINKRKKEKKTRKLYRALNKYPLNVWHIDVLEFGFKSEAALNRAEIRWIKKFDSKNKGYNCTDGGEGVTGLKHSDETKQKLREINQGKKLTREAKDKIGRAHKGKVTPIETKIKMSEAQIGVKNHNYGKKLSEETRKRMSESKLGIKFSKEHRENISKARKGIKFSEEHLKNMSLAQTGKKHSQEVRMIMKKAQRLRRKKEKENESD
jgi:group I intron endonuclease